MPQERKYRDQAERQRAYRERQAAARWSELAKKGLPASAAVPTMPSQARWSGLLASALQNVETARDEMQTYWDERTERWQDSERGEAMAERIAALEQVALDLLDAAAGGG